MATIHRSVVLRTVLFGMGALALLGSMLLLVAWRWPIMERADATILGIGGYGYSGKSVAIVGDVNGDGYDDVLVGAYNTYIDARGGGSTFLFLGGPNETWQLDMSLDQADASFAGEVLHDMAGRSVAAAGDVNGDGLDDMLIGAYGALTHTGKAYLILGREEADWGEAFDLATADASFVGEGDGDEVGMFLSHADVNGDGLSDLILGAHMSDLGAEDGGAAYVILGDRSVPWGQYCSVARADASFVGGAQRDFAGWSVAGAGDVNGDGLGDFLIGAVNADGEEGLAGRTHLILGRRAADWGTGYSLAAADAVFLGEGYDDGAGTGVAGIGDVNGDGLSDIAIGADCNDDGDWNGGQVYFVFGRRAADWGGAYPLSGADASFAGCQAAAYMGRALAGVGDVNRDGYDDVLIGAAMVDAGDVLTDSGAVYVVFGRPDGWAMDTPLDDVDDSNAVMALDGESEGDQFGEAVAGGGDVNGDGFPDMVIGAWRNDDGANLGGKTYLEFGSGMTIDNLPDGSLVELGGTVDYCLAYANTNEWDVEGVRIVDRLPQACTYVEATGGMTRTVGADTVVWYLGTVPAGGSGQLGLTLRVRPEILPGTTITNTAWITSPGRLNVVIDRAEVRVVEERGMICVPLVLR